MFESHLRWFGHVLHQPTNAPVCKYETMVIVSVKEISGRPKITWEGIVSKDLQCLGINVDLVKDRAQWKKKIHIGVIY